MNLIYFEITNNFKKNTVYSDLAFDYLTGRKHISLGIDQSEVFFLTQSSFMCIL